MNETINAIMTLTIFTEPITDNARVSGLDPTATPLFGAWLPSPRNWQSMVGRKESTGKPLLMEMVKMTLLESALESSRIKLHT